LRLNAKRQTANDQRQTAKRETGVSSIWARLTDCAWPQTLPRHAPQCPPGLCCLCVYVRLCVCVYVRVWIHRQGLAFDTAVLEKKTRKFRRQDRARVTWPPVLGTRTHTYTHTRVRVTCACLSCVSPYSRYSTHTYTHTHTHTHTHTRIPYSWYSIHVY
jgi:hypothetical protein